MDPSMRDACLETASSVSTCFKNDVEFDLPHTSSRLVFLMYAGIGSYEWNQVTDSTGGWRTTAGDCSTQSFGFSNLKISVATDPFAPTPSPVSFAPTVSPVPSSL